ncbi:TonB-dependent receptor plug domain-containing protein [Flavisphingomonas formosensis]|uniref:TonB-dependent receptor plug domain-containing protein n=1 Tax=Flavisphingomonas formosensis TaxID=861534 RepID=UPI001E43E354|nr:TonB-dependent receptor [Sphingomonas formosensis]
MISRTAAAVALGLGCAGHALAENADDGENIVVTGQSIEEELPQQLSRYGSDIETLSETQVRDRGAVDVATALDTVPGLYIKPGSGPFSYVDISLQGSRTQDVLWTVDGIRINNRLYGSTSPNDTLPASMIERVEVLKGGESLFYGTQAAAGVINVVTRSFTDDFNGQVNGSVDSRAGTNLDGYARGSAGRHKFVVYASRNHAEGYRPYSEMQPSASDRRRGYRLWSIGGKYQYDFTSDLRLNLQYQHTQAKLDNLSAVYVNKSRNDRNEEIASARLDYTGNDAVQFFLKGYFHDWKTAYVQLLNIPGVSEPVTVYPPGTFWGYQDYGGSALIKLHLHRGLEYLFGYDFQTFNGRDDVLLIGKLDEKVHAGIFQVRTTDEISRRAHFSAGLRYNKTGGAKKTIWNVSGRYDIGAALYAEANGGTSFLLPDASSLYGIDPCCEVGNPNLKPEQSLNLNATIGGGAHLSGATIDWKLTGFTRRITDLIDADYDNPAYPNGIYVNVPEKVTVRGAELVLDASLGEAWHMSASYTYTRSRNAGSSLQRDRTPKQFAKGSIAYDPSDRPFGANVAINWVGDAWSTISGFGRRNYGNYAVVDLGAHVYLDGAARRHRAGLTLENAFDKDYATRGYGSAPLDDGSGRFLYHYRGVPRTLRVSYGVSF